MQIDILSQMTVDEVCKFHLSVSDNSKKQSSLHSVSLNSLVSALCLSKTHPFLLVYLLEDEKKRMLIESGEVERLCRFAVSKSSVREENYWRRIDIQELSAIELRDGDEGLLLFPQLPPNELLAWPMLVTEYDSIYINKTDEFFNISTVNNDVKAILAQFPPLDTKAHFTRSI